MLAAELEIHRRRQRRARSLGGLILGLALVAGLVCAYESEAGALAATSAVVREIRGAALANRPDSPELRGIAARIVRAVPIVMFRDDPALCDITIDALRAVGSCREIEGAAAWARPCLTHPETKVRRAAAVWYPKIDPAWASDPETKKLVDEARGSR